MVRPIAWALGLGLLLGSAGSVLAETVAIDTTAADTVSTTSRPLTALEDAALQASLAPEEPYWSFRLAELHLLAGAVADAETALVATIAIDSTYTPALSLLSRLYFENGRHEEAVEMLETLRSSPESFPAGIPRQLLEGLALHYDALDEIGLARAVMTEILQQSADLDGSTRVYLTLRGENPDSAEALAGEALKQNPGSAVNHNNYGITRLRAGDLPAARQAFLAAVDVDPGLPGPYYNLAILEKFYVFDEEAAAEWFRLYRERSLDDPDGLFAEFGVAESHASREESH
jgi:tetratricopeptide (TPR) repeat protein